MSRDTPMLASEKIKLGIIIFIVGVASISAVFAFGKFLYYKIARDDENYQQAVEKASEYYHFEVYDYNEDYNRYKLSIEPKVWKSMNKANKTDYCSKCYETLSGFLWKYKIKPEDESPYIYFYCDQVQVAHLFNGIATILS